jgi:hypothetical protein
MQCRFLFLTAACSIFLGEAFAQVGERRAELISRCFFVYAPIYEVAGQTGDTKLRTYALQRLMYVRGLTESLRSDPVFERVFTENLSRNRSAGIAIERMLPQAIRAGDATSYNAQLDIAAECDRQFGL